MRKRPALDDLRKANEERRAKTRALIELIRTRKFGAVVTRAESLPREPDLGTSTNVAAGTQARTPDPSPQIVVGAAGLRFFTRSDPTVSCSHQPWTLRLIEAALQAVASRSTTLCLVWPARLESVAPIHALATIERNVAKDLKGIRTVFFPGNYATKSSLSAWLADRKQLAELYRSLWTIIQARHELICVRQSKSMLAVLASLNSIENQNPHLTDPSLGEINPIFIFDTDTGDWHPLAAAPLERTLRKLASLRYRAELREKIGSEWGDPREAPNALMLVHGNSRKEIWRRALQSCSRSTQADLLLFDATSAADQRDRASVRRITEFLKVAREDHPDPGTGALIVTDDPVTFFSLRARIQDCGIALATEVLPAESDQSLLSASPLPVGWKPEQKSNSRFTIGIVDRDAAAVAVAFQDLASEMGQEGAPGQEQLMDACLYILRLSNLPAGYSDLTAEVASREVEEFSSTRFAWASVEHSLRSVPLSGAFANRKTDIDVAIAKAQGLVDQWSNATPMALRLQGIVRKYTLESNSGLIVVLQNQRYIRLCYRFLSRTLGDPWSAIEGRIEWHTLSTIGKRIGSGDRPRPIVFVGVNRNVLRIILGHVDVPHGTELLIAYRQAESILTTLRGMKALEELKAYRGRIGLLIQELDRRLGEIPKSPKLERLRDLSLTFPASDGTDVSAAAEQRLYKFRLEDDGCTYRSGWVFRYEPDDDPPFRRASASTIQKDDLIFEMSDSLRGKIESALQISGGELNSAVHPGNAFLQLYHNDIQRRCASLFTAKKRSALAREIHAKMIQTDAGAAGCRPARVYYWLDIKPADSRPHASTDARYFRLFCKALDISDETALNYWNLVRDARVQNQSLGRLLAAQYAEILFQPESASVYRQISPQLVYQLRQEALRCVFRVIDVVAPSNTK
jgi:hypothetical protein